MNTLVLIKQGPICTVCATGNFFKVVAMRAALFMLFVLGLQSTLLAANHYIRAGATGIGDGSSWANAWPTFASATWTRGDTYYVAGGIYTGNVSITKAVSGTTQIIIKKANVADNSTDSGWSSSYASLVAEINGTLSINSGYITWDGVTGFEETGHGFKIYQASLAGNGTVVNFDSAGSNFTFAHTEVMGSGFGAGATGQDGIYFNCTGKKNFWVHHCYIHEVTRNGVLVGGLLGTSYDDYGFLFENNVIAKTGGCTNVDIHGQGMQIAYGSHEAFTIIRNNKFRDILGTSYIYFLGGTGSIHSDGRIYNNVFYATDLSLGYGSVSPGIIACHDSCNSFDRFVISNNTFYNIGSTLYPSRAELTFASSNGGSRTNIIAKNNVWENCHFPYIHSGVTEESNNAYYNCTGGTAPYGVPVNTTKQIGCLSSTLSKPAIGDFLVKENGYALNAGADMSDIYNTDISGTRRSTYWEVGAYEYKETAPRNAVTKTAIQ